MAEIIEHKQKRILAGDKKKSKHTASDQPEDMPKKRAKVDKIENKSLSALVQSVQTKSNRIQSNQGKMKKKSGRK